MKTIDFHTHIFPKNVATDLRTICHKTYKEFNKLNLNTDYFFEIMDKYNIDQSIVHPLQFDEWFYTPNEFVSELVHRYPDKLIKFSTFDPLANNSFEILENEYSSGTMGIKLYPPTGFYPHNKKFNKLYEFISDHSLPVLFHCGVPFYYPKLMSKFSKPLYFDDLALRFPKLKIVLSHFCWPWYQEAIAMAWRHENIYLDTSALYDTHVLSEAIERISAEKIIFGSDFMGETESLMLKTFHILEYIRKNLSEKDMKKILFNNSNRVLPKRS